MDNYKLVKERHSVRSYLDKEIDSKTKEEIVKVINECNKEGNLNIKLFTNEEKVFNTFLAHYGKFNNVKNYIVLIGKKDNTLEERCGYYGEKIVLKLEELGLNSCFVGLTYGKSKVPYKLTNNEKIVCTIAIGYGVNKGVDHKIKTFNEVSKSTDVPDWYKKGVEYALHAPTAMNQQKFTFELIDKDKVKVKAGSGFYTKVDLGIVKYNFELGAGKDNFKWI